MTPDQAKAKIEQLRATLNQHNYDYYVRAQPRISDFEYDLLINELQTLEHTYPQFDDANSPTRRVGSDLNVEFESFPHRYPMLSLGNTYSKEELEEFETQ